MTPGTGAAVLEGPAHRPAYDSSEGFHGFPGHGDLDTLDGLDLDSPDGSDGNSGHGESLDPEVERAIRPYLDKVVELGVRTERDAATFYLGGRGIARGHAEQFASSSGATTLESTAGGRWLDELWRFDRKDRPRLTTEEADTVWRETSRLYAEQASGNVRAFVSNPKTTSVFVTVELPALKQGMAEGRIYSITIVDVATGKTTVLRPDERGPHGR